MLVIRVGVLAVMCAAGIQTGMAQDVFSEQRSDGAGSLKPDSAGTTEESDFSQGGFFGLGAQKPMKRVRGIRLPEQQAKAGFSNIQQPHSQPLPAEFMQTARLSKPEACAPTTDFPARMVYLNGRNVSSVREQQLEAVNVSIDSNGNIHITAPHYEVQESTHYRPLFGKDLPKFSKPTAQREEPPVQMNNSAAAAVPSQPEIPVPPISSDDSSKIE